MELEELKKKVEYLPETGEFFYISKKRRPVRNISNDYVIVSVGGKMHLGHRLAVFYMTGEWPPEGIFVDHINGNRQDNSWKNLRLATPQQNSQNKSKASWKEHKGVSERQDKAGNTLYYCTLKNGDKVKTWGTFEKSIQAAKSYDRKSIELFGEFARTNFDREIYKKDLDLPMFFKVVSAKYKILEVHEYVNNYPYTNEDKVNWMLGVEGEKWLILEAPLDEDGHRIIEKITCQSPPTIMDDFPAMRGIYNLDSHHLDFKKKKRYSTLEQLRGMTRIDPKKLNMVVVTVPRKPSHEDIIENFLLK